jgi:RHS repeat-associated protein
MGNRISRKDGKGALTQYAFFPDDLLQRIAYADGKAVSYAYDADNRRTQMSDWLGATSWQHDPLGRVTGTKDPLGSALAYAYDADSNRTALTYPDGSVTEYAYSPNSWLQQFRDAEGQVIEYSRNKVGGLTKIVNPNQTETEIEYDRVYRTLRRATTAKGSEIVAGFEYAYNELGHVTEAVKRYGWRNPEEQRESYAYDGLRRLTGTTIAPLKNNGNAVEMSYAYDAVGNRLSWATDDDLSTQQPGDGFTRTYAYNPANQLLRAETASLTANPNRSPVQEYRYDGNGSRIGRTERDSNGPVKGTDYSFDPENRLIRALDWQLTGKGRNRIDRAVTALDYDGGGRRLAQSYDPKAGKGGVKRTEYAFDKLDPVAEYNELNGQHDNYYRGDDGQISLSQHFNSGAAGQLHWYHYDRKGDVAGLTKQNGNAAHTYRYEPYGAVIPANGNFTDPHNHYTLTGKEFDENTGLVWFGARHYEPETGVWMGQDNFRGIISIPESINRYVHQNPVTYYDEYGNDIPLIVKAVSAIVDYGWDLWDAGRDIYILHSKNSSDIDKQVAGEDLAMIMATELAEPDEGLLVNTPADDFVRKAFRKTRKDALEKAARETEQKIIDESLKQCKVTRAERWIQLAEEGNKNISKQQIDYINKNGGKDVYKNFGLELAHRPKRSAAQGFDYKAMPKYSADHRGIEHRYLIERGTGTTFNFGPKPRTGSILDVPHQGSLP